MAPKTQAIVAIIPKEGKYLLGKRAEWKRSAPGYWCPVTGKVEAGETEPEAVIREVFEEVGLEVEVVAKMVSMDSNDGLVKLHWWMTRIVSGEAYLKNDEHSELGWFTPDEMSQLTPIFQEDLELFLSLTQSGSKK
jgi:8-oxo-dGTP pyrophosphatase MutT (NUDIX family)